MTAAEQVLKWMKEYYEVNGTPNYGEVVAQLEMAIDEENRTNKVLMPKELTAENGAKGLLLGEFHEVIEHGPNDEVLKIPVSWSNVKSIYKKAVEHFAA